MQIPRKISSILVDNYPPLRLNDEKARLDNFAIQLQNDPSAKGYVIVYGAPRANSAEKQKRIKEAFTLPTLGDVMQNAPLHLPGAEDAAAMAAYPRLAQGRVLGCAGGRVRCDHGAVGLRQVNASAPDGRTLDANERAHNS